MKTRDKACVLAVTLMLSACGTSPTASQSSPVASLPASVDGEVPSSDEPGGLGKYTYDGQERAECRRGTRTGSRIHRLSCGATDPFDTTTGIPEILTPMDENQRRIGK